MIYSFVPYVGIVTCVSFLVHLTVIKYHKLSGLKQGKFILPQSPKVCSLHLCLFCYLTYRVIVPIFLNSMLLLLLLLLSHVSHVRLYVTPQMAAHQAPPSLGFSRKEHWNGLPFPSPMHESEK